MMPDLAATSHRGLWRQKHPLLIATWFLTKFLLFCYFCFEKKIKLKSKK